MAASLNSIHLVLDLYGVVGMPAPMFLAICSPPVFFSQFRVVNGFSFRHTWCRPTDRGERERKRQKESPVCKQKRDGIDKRAMFFRGLRICQ